MKNVLFLPAVLSAAMLIASGCASTSKQEPTHFWDAADAKSGHEYRVDNAQCESANGAQASNPMLAESGAFQAYKDCMLSRGYVLRTY